MILKKYFILLAIAVLGCKYMTAQNMDDLGKIVIGVDFSENASSTTKDLAEELKNKLISIITSLDYSSFENNYFTISPNIIIDEVGVAESGMKNIYLIKGHLYISLSNKYDKTIFSTISLPFNGSGKKENLAIKNSIMNLDFKPIIPMLNDAKNKILTFYTDRKDKIFATADTYTKNGQYDKAITCLMTIPDDLTEIKQKALQKACEIYDLKNEAIKQKHLYIRKMHNDSILISAKNFLAMHKPIDALKSLWDFQVGNNKQTLEYNKLLTNAEKQISASERKQLAEEKRAHQERIRKEHRIWQMQMQNANYSYNLSQAKIDAVKSIAIEYIRRNRQYIIL